MRFVKRIFFVYNATFKLYSHTCISYGFIYSCLIDTLYIYICTCIYTHIHICIDGMYFTFDMYFVSYFSLPIESTIVVVRNPCTYWHCIYLHYWSYTNLRLISFVVKTTSNKAYSILILLYFNWIPLFWISLLAYTIISVLLTRITVIIDEPYQLPYNVILWLCAR